jgi:hypothetical protein
MLLSSALSCAALACSACQLLMPNAEGPRPNVEDRITEVVFAGGRLWLQGVRNAGLVSYDVETLLGRVEHFPSDVVDLSSPDGKELLVLRQLDDTVEISIER